MAYIVKKLWDVAAKQASVEQLFLQKWRHYILMEENLSKNVKGVLAMNIYLLLYVYLST